MNHSSGSMNMGGMDMDMGGGGSCKISMLWNWYTIDACFLSEGWHIRNRGMFAATCIGVALMTVCLEALRRGCREYDLLIVRQWRAHANSVQQSHIQQNIRSGSTKSIDNQDEIQTSTTPLQTNQQSGSTTQYLTFKPYLENSSSITFRATPIQQLIRAILHAATFGLAYILMLLVMYFNGYIIISIILGAGVGKFVCDWMTSTITIDVGFQGNEDVNLVGQRIRNHEDPTVCC